MHPHDNTNASQPTQPTQPYLPPAPATWPVQGVEPVDQATAPKRGRNTAAWIVGVIALVVALCCTGAVVLGLASAGDGEQQTRANVAPEITVTATTAPTTSAPASTTPAAPTTTAPEPEPTPATTGRPLGSTVTVALPTPFGEVAVTVSKSRTYPKPRKSACNPYMPDPDQGYYLVLDVKVQVVSGRRSINPLFFEFVDADGATSSGLTGAFSGCGKSLDSGNDFRKGTKRSGQLVFDAASVKGEVIFSDALGTPLASWRIG